MKKTNLIFYSTLLIYIVLIFAPLVGEIRCIYKACNCNWEPIGKAEIIYTAAAFTGLGAVVGWFDIKDN